MNCSVVRLFAIGLVWAASILSAGCGDDGNAMPDGGNVLPDGFVVGGCYTIDDCAVTKCQQVKCNIVTHMCEYKEKVCTPESECTTATCELATGSCIQQAANDQAMCTTTSGGMGACLGGTCIGIPTCAPTSSFGSTVSCSSSSFSSAIHDSNDTGFSGSGAANVSAYACAPTEIGPEAVYTFKHDAAAGDEDVTLSLRLVDSFGADIADQTVVDLDLIVLEDSCTGTSVCKNAAITGGFAGVTTGTSKERVSFRALAGKSYFIVVDGKDAAQVHDFVIEAESCGLCQPSDGTRIDCNTSTPINTSTASGTASLSNYTCGAGMTAVSSPGKEIPFYFKSVSEVQRNVTATLTGATAAFNLFALPDTSYGQCDPTKCIGYASGASGAQTLTWPIAASSGTSFTRYWLVVDAATATDTSFGLTLACDPYCLSPYSLRCGSGSDLTTITNGTTVGGLTQADHWGPSTGCDGLTGLTGPETTVKFTPTVGVGGALYQVQLFSKSGKNLSMTVLDGGTTAGVVCSPSFACVFNTVEPASANFTGTRSTNSATVAAGLNFHADKDHLYYIVVDSPDATGGTFDMKVVGQGGGSGCL